MWVRNEFDTYKLSLFGSGSDLAAILYCSFKTNFCWQYKVLG